MFLITLTPHHLKQYKDIVQLLIEHSRLASVQDEEIENLDSVEASDLSRSAEQLASDLEKMGPTFVKLGQLLATRADLLSYPYSRGS